MTAEGSCRVVSNDGEVYEKPWSAPHLAWSPAGWWSFGPAASWPRRG